MSKKNRVVFWVSESLKNKLLILLSNKRTKSKCDFTIVADASEFYYQIFGMASFPNAIVLENFLDVDYEKIAQCLAIQHVSSRVYFIASESGCEVSPFKEVFTPDEVGLHRLLNQLVCVNSASYSEYTNSRKKMIPVHYLEVERLNNSYRNILNGAGEGIIGLDEYGCITFANPMAAKILGKSVSQLIGRSFFEFTGDSPLKLGSSSRSFTKNKSVMSRVERGLIERDDGSTVFVEYTHSYIGLNDQKYTSVLVIEEITERIKFENALKAMATYDRLTGIFNRGFYEIAVKKELANTRGKQWVLTQCLIDLDGFKQINDRYGHVVGDAVLIEVAQRLKACVRREDMVARLGGDEFVILFKNTHLSSVREIAENIVDVINDPITVNDINVQVGCSIGICELEEHEQSIESALTN